MGEKTEFSLYLKNLVLDVDYRRGSISAGEVDEVLSNGNVVQYAFRIAETSEKWNYLSSAYCILEDNSGMNLKGYFISQETGEGTTQYSIRAYPKN